MLWNPLCLNLVGPAVYVLTHSTTLIMNFMEREVSEPMWLAVQTYVCVSDSERDRLCL